MVSFFLFTTQKKKKKITMNRREKNALQKIHENEKMLLFLP